MNASNCALVKSIYNQFYFVGKKPMALLLVLRLLSKKPKCHIQIENKIKIKVRAYDF